MWIPKYMTILCRNIQFNADNKNKQFRPRSVDARRRRIQPPVRWPAVRIRCSVAYRLSLRSSLGYQGSDIAVESISVSNQCRPRYTNVEGFGQDEDYESEEEIQYVTLDLGDVEPQLVPSSTTYQLIGSFSSSWLPKSFIHRRNRD